MNDTDATGKVAHNTEKNEVRLFPTDLDLTEPQGYMIEEFNRWTRAQTDPAFRRNLEAWENLRYNVDWYMQGGCTYLDSVQAVGKERAGEHFAAIVTIAKHFAIFAWAMDSEGESE